LSDFLADGLKTEKKGKGGWIVFALTFLPSLLIVIFYPSIFIKALSYAGICCAILLVLMPALMAWNGRYRKNLAVGQYQVFGGKVSVLFLIFIAIAVLALGVIKTI
jgi:tyrosine-specific transport protein